MTASSLQAVVAGQEGRVQPDGTTVAIRAPADGERSGALDATRRRTGAVRRMHAVSVLGDTTGVAAACMLVTIAEPWLGPSTVSSERYRFALLAGPLMLAVLVARSVRGRSRRIAPRVADDLGSLLTALGLAGLSLLALSAIGPLASWLPPVEVGLAIGTTVLLVPAGRAVVLYLASLEPTNKVRVLIVGAGVLADELSGLLSRSRMVTVVGVVDDPPHAAPGVIGGIGDLPALCESEHVDRVVVAFARRHPSRCAEILQQLRGDVDIDVIVRYYELAGWESRLSDVTGLTLVSIGRAAGPVASAAKRALDVSVAVSALALLSPLLLVVAAAVRLESHGPALFRQTRIGRGRRPFRILKFRTMSVGSEPARFERPRTPLDYRPEITRVTRLGKFLRRSGLDELPQLVNVLRGEMSLVGPRPFVPEECASLEGMVEHRFEVRPGMTGLWQVCGQHEVSFEELCRLDFQYATSWSLGGDLRILARTPGRLLRGSASVRSSL